MAGLQAIIAQTAEKILTLPTHGWSLLLRRMANRLSRTKVG
ncbi:hypothetical protein [Mesorhizobium sp. 43Arga]